MTAEFIAASLLSMALIAFGSIEYKAAKRRAKRRSPEVARSLPGVQ